VTVVLFDRQIQFLDRLAARIRLQHGAAISRAQLIRALVDSVGNSLEASAGDPAAETTAKTDCAAGVDPGIDLDQTMLARLGVGRRKS
jgi:hypothetical protein